MSRIWTGESQLPDLQGPRLYIRRLMMRREKRGHAPYQHGEEITSSNKLIDDMYKHASHHSLLRTSSHPDILEPDLMSSKLKYDSNKGPRRHILQRADFSRLKAEPLDDSRRSKRQSQKAFPVKSPRSPNADDVHVIVENDPCWRESHMNAVYSARDFESRFRERYYQDVSGISGVCKRRLHTVAVSSHAIEDRAHHILYSREQYNPITEDPDGALSPDEKEGAGEETFSMSKKDQMTDELPRSDAKLAKMSPAQSPEPIKVHGRSKSVLGSIASSPRTRRAKTSGTASPGWRSTSPTIEAETSWRQLVLSEIGLRALSRATTRTSSPIPHSLDVHHLHVGGGMRSPTAAGGLGSVAERVVRLRQSRSADVLALADGRPHRSASADGGQTLYGKFKNTVLDWQSQAAIRRNAAPPPAEQAQVVKRSCGGADSSVLLDNKHRTAAAAARQERARSHSGEEAAEPPAGSGTGRSLSPTARFALGPIAAPGRHAGAAPYGGLLFRGGRESPDSRPRRGGGSSGGRLRVGVREKKDGWGGSESPLHEWDNSDKQRGFFSPA